MIQGHSPVDSPKFLSPMSIVDISLWLRLPSGSLLLPISPILGPLNKSLVVRIIKAYERGPINQY